METTLRQKLANTNIVIFALEKQDKEDKDGA